MADTLFVNASTTVPGTPIVAPWMNDVNTNTYTILASIAGTNTITGTGAVTVTVGYPRGVAFRFLPAGANTGPVTINISGLGVKNVTKFGTTPLVANDLIGGMWAYIAYDGVQFQLINPRTTDFVFPTGTLPAANLSGQVAIANGGTGASTATAGFAALSAGTTLSFRNKLINGLGTINQRGYVSGAATVGANQYTVDRWRVVTNGQNLTFVASGNGMLLTAPAGGVEQVIEGNNMEGGVYTLSWIGTATATVNGAAVTNGGQTASLTAGADATVRFIGGTFSFPQLEKSVTATTFEQRHFGIEFALCQRYLPAWQISNTSEDIAMGLTSSTAGGVVSFSMPVQPRVAPTGVTVVNLAGFSVVSAGASTVATGIAFSVGGSKLTSLSIAGTGTPYTIGQVLVLRGTSGGTKLLFTGCEL
jgi:hypothetical protein